MTRTRNEIEATLAGAFPREIVDFLADLNQKGEFWLVGGCVRDALLGRTPKDFDILTTTPEVAEALGMHQIGKDFPVWQVQVAMLSDGPDRLHTIEIASARTERKTGRGHTGFITTVTRDVEADLQRRDLTINALAWRPGDFRSPTRALFDLEQNVLRHVSPAFAEDPLRVFRVARFAAQLGGLWEVSPETLNLMQELAPELDSLPKDRVREELSKVFKSAKPERFFRVLRDADCLDHWFPEIVAMCGCAQGEEHHPEGDVFEHTMWVMRKAKEMGCDELEMLCALGHDFGKPLCPAEQRPHYYEHEKLGLGPIQAFCDRLGYGEGTRKAMSTVCVHHMTTHRVTELRPSTLLNLYKSVRRGQLGLEGFLRVCQADHCGRGLRYWDTVYGQAGYLRGAVQAVAPVVFLEGSSVARFEQEQITVLKRYKMNFQAQSEG
jgi:tRNA nucleotidyltransferase (CCA-adding enzyme)